MNYDDIDFPLALGRETTPESASAMLAIAVLAQATKEKDVEFLTDDIVNTCYYRWFGITGLGYLFKEL